MAVVEFLSADFNFKLPEIKKTREWLGACAKREKCTLELIQYIFCSDQYLLAINRDYLKHDTLTDIITFDYSNGRHLEGEIYISLERVRENARQYGVLFSEELRRVMVHGVLHLAGHSDKSAREKAQMRKREDACLSLWKK